MDTATLKQLSELFNHITTPDDLEKVLHVLGTQALMLKESRKTTGRALAYWGAAHRLMRQACDELKDVRS